MTANDEGSDDRDAFFDRFRDDDAFAEALSSAASMKAAVSLAAAHGYTITRETLVHAATGTREPHDNPLLRLPHEPPERFAVTDPGDY